MRGTAIEGERHGVIDSVRSSRIPSSLAGVVRNRDFRLLWAGEGVSLLGDQFYLIALPWLVLKLTGDTFAIGTVLALSSIPRALFMLVGGALTDRLSPRVMMMISNASRMVLVGALALLVATGSVELWMLYAFALMFGLASAFFFPAQSAIIPRILGSDRLQTGNAIIQGTAQLSVFLGPALAGTLIALVDGGGAGAPDMTGIGIALAVDAATFLVSAATLSMVHLAPRIGTSGAPAAKSGVFSSIREGLAAVWQDRTLRYYFVLIGAVNLLMTGPISVGIPVLADTRFAGGAVAFGLILSAFGGGSLLGVIVAGVCPRPSARKYPLLMLGSTATMGVGLTMLGALPFLTPAAIAAFAMGLGQGYVVIQFITWLQLRSAPHMLGRMMSVLMFAVVGLAPVSSTAAGALMHWNPAIVIAGAGLLMVAVVAVAALSPSVWNMTAPAKDEDRREEADPAVADPAGATPSRLAA